MRPQKKTQNMNFQNPYTKNMCRVLQCRVVSCRVLNCWVYPILINWLKLRLVKVSCFTILFQRLFFCNEFFFLTSYQFFNHIFVVQKKMLNCSATNQQLINFIHCMNLGFFMFWMDQFSGLDDQILFIAIKFFGQLLGFCPLI